MQKMKKKIKMTINIKLPIYKIRTKLNLNEKILKKIKAKKSKHKLHKIKRKLKIVLFKKT